MISSAHDPKFVLCEWLTLKIARVLRRPQCAENEIEVACTQAGRERFERSLHRRDAQSWILGHHAGDRLREKAGAPERQRAHRDGTLRDAA
jgi:hypothetical protein